MSKAAELAALIGSQSSLSNRNLIINGAMQVAQRSTSETVGDSATYKTLDRWQIAINGTTAGRATMSRSSDAPNGFGHSMKFEVTTADTSIASTESFGVYQRIEGQNVQSLKKGTSDAQVATLSFYAKGTPNTYITEFRDASARQVSATFDVTSSWQRFEIQVPADTTGTITNDNTLGFLVLFWLHAGTDFTSGTLNTSWAASVNANRMVGCDSLFSAVSNTLQITGVQLELGEQATPFEHRSFADEMLRCQRYFCGLSSTGTTPVVESGYIYGYTWENNNIAGSEYYSPVDMRAQPTLSYTASFPATWDSTYYRINGVRKNKNSHTTGSWLNYPQLDAEL